MQPVWKKSIGLKKEDLNSAINWARKAAENGDLHSQYALAQMLSGTSKLTYQIGKSSVPAKLKEAKDWYRKAAEHGHSDAAFWIAMSFSRKGINKSRDTASTESENIESLTWLKVAEHMKTLAPDTSSRSTFDSYIKPLEKKLSPELQKKAKEKSLILIEEIKIRIKAMNW